MALRNKSFGSAQEFVWAADTSEYAIREGSSRVKLFNNFKEKKSFKPVFGCDGIYGGNLLGVRASNSLSFYDWESQDLIRRIEIQVKHVVWSDSGELVCIATEGTCSTTLRQSLRLCPATRAWTRCCPPFLIKTRGPEWPTSWRSRTSCSRLWRSPRTWSTSIAHHS